MLVSLLIGATLAAAPAPVAPPAPTPGHPVALPTVFLDNRFAVAPVLEGGKRLVFYTDSGGGTEMLDAAVAGERHLPVKQQTREGRTFQSTPWPRFSNNAFIPAPAERDFLVLMPKLKPQFETDGFLGGGWFADKVWTFDYPGKTLWWRAAGDLPKADAAHVIPLHFQTENGQRTTHFARMEIEVDGEKLPMLLDTGATFMLAPSAVKALGGGPAMRGGSFITQRMFEKWRKAHPDWRVIPAADAKGKLPLIEVAKVKVAGETVGPVWFAERPNKAFDGFMSSFMDAHVEGAFGGSGLHFFRVTVDYPNAKAVFEKP